MQEEEEEDARVTELLDQSEDVEEKAPVLLTGSTTKNKEEQLETLLSKAQQYTNFIIKSTEPPPLKRQKIMVDQPRTMVGGTLKNYQIEGLRWMATLYENGLSGILADEMGLGKTIQVIALVAHLREKNVTGPIIVTAPLATLPNWQNEFKKWTPSIQTLLYHGSKKERQEMRKSMSMWRVIITSYEICIIDRASLSHFDFKYLVVDEGQRVKNRDCRLVRELKKLRTENRLLLSGTPIQNTLEELWSLLNFVNPSIFDDLRVFQSWFGFDAMHVDDILEHERRNRIVNKLHEILRPFLLRRVKKDVLRDALPPKKEIVVYCPMTSLQKTLEIEIREDRIRETLLKSGIEVSQQNKLMNQRKNANHPFLFGEPSVRGQPITHVAPDSLMKSSGKFQLLEVLLPRLKGHKILIFSQMTELLNLLEDYLRFKEYSFYRIDGSVTLAERQRQIDAFNSDSTFIFMLSTRAGGLGINLAAADTCILFDSDWNPQQDSQAMDRCHRIGQTKPVVVYRLLTAGSVEIGMMDKQISKKKLERMAIAGGNFKRAGRRADGKELDINTLKALLADDVDVSSRFDTAAQDTIDDTELDLILDRDKIFSSDGIPPEGKLYDVVHDGNDDGFLNNLN